jgi:hypothetical protein
MYGVTENDLIAVVLPFALAAILVAIAIIKPPRWLRERLAGSERARGRWLVSIVAVALAANLTLLGHAIMAGRPGSFIFPAFFSALLAWRLFQVVRERSRARSG